MLAVNAMLAFSVIRARTRKTSRRREEKEGLPAVSLLHQFLLFSFAPSVSLWQLVLRSLVIPYRFSQKDTRELSWNLEEVNLTKKKEGRHWEQDSGRSLSLFPAPSIHPAKKFHCSSMSGMLVIHKVTVSILVKFPQTVLPHPYIATHLHIWKEAEAAFNHDAYGITLNRAFWRLQLRVRSIGKTGFRIWNPDFRFGIKRKRQRISTSWNPSPRLWGVKVGFYV